MKVYFKSASIRLVFCTLLIIPLLFVSGCYTKAYKNVPLKDGLESSFISTGNNSAKLLLRRENKYGGSAYNGAFYINDEHHITLAWGEQHQFSVIPGQYKLHSEPRLYFLPHGQDHTRFVRFEEGKSYTLTMVLMANMLLLLTDSELEMYSQQDYSFLSTEDRRKVAQGYAIQRVANQLVKSVNANREVRTSSPSITCKFCIDYREYLNPVSTPVFEIGRTPASAGNCKSDYDCSGNMQCVKPTYSKVGSCMSIANEMGVKQPFGYKKQNNIGPNMGRQCTVTSPCPLGYRCIDGNCIK